MTITIPNPALVLLVGPAGAGKSSFAAANFRKSEIVSSDDMREMMTDDAGDQGASAEAFQVLAIIVNGRLRRRLLTVVDATNLRAANRIRYDRQAARYGIPTVVIAFDLAAAAYRARNAGRVDRVVPESVVANHAERMAGVLEVVEREGHAAVHVLRTDDQVAGIGIVREPA